MAFDMVLGVFSIIVCVYCAALLAFHVLTPKGDDASKFVMVLSYCSLVCMALSALTIALTYFSPRLGSTQDCYCHFLWSASLVFYVLALYLLKGMYVTRTRILNKGAVFTTKRTSIGVNIVSLTMTCTALTCVTMCIFRAGGQCYADIDAKGCIPTFDLSVLYIAIAMISLDSMLFASFCFTWYKLLAIFKLTENDRKIPTDAVRSFMTQFSVTVTALASCVLDSIFHLIWYKDDGSNYTPCMIAYCLDMMVVATCNVLMIGETRKRVASWLRVCCPWNPLLQEPKTREVVPSKTNREPTNTSTQTRTQLSSAVSNSYNTEAKKETAKEMTEITEAPTETAIEIAQ